MLLLLSSSLAKHLLEEDDDEEATSCFLYGLGDGIVSREADEGALSRVVISGGADDVDINDVCLGLAVLPDDALKRAAFAGGVERIARFSSLGQESPDSLPTLCVKHGELCLSGGTVRIIEEEESGESLVGRLGITLLSCDVRFNAGCSESAKCVYGFDVVRESCKGENSPMLLFKGGNVVDEDADVLLSRCIAKTKAFPPCVRVRMLSPADVDDSQLPAGPCICVLDCADDTRDVDVRLSGLCYAGLRCSSATFISRLTANLCDQMNAAESIVLADGNCASISAYRFTVDDVRQLETPVVVVYSSREPLGEQGEISWKEEQGDALVAIRKSIHRELGVAQNRPRFLSSCSDAFAFESKGSKSPLRNVHMGKKMKPHGLNASSASVHLVRGSYEYYHYLMEGFNDKGWGCAYRSLMTLTSWFKLNHYIPPDVVPGHREIQETLTRVDDKPASFVGSKTWIGSQEVGYCLEALGGIASRFVFCSQGSQVPNHIREFMLHFDTHGTPVMIGGGQLAFTLLGVALDEKSGETRYLILDPHYVGPDKLDAIQSKTVLLEGYRSIPCTWRGPDMFDERTFYNFCLPLVPDSSV